MPKIVRNLTGQPIELALTVGGVPTTTVIFGGKVPLADNAEVVGELPNGLLIDDEESPVVVEEQASPQPNPPVDTSDEEDTPLVNKPKK